MCILLTTDMHAERNGCVKGVFLSNSHRTFSICRGHAFTLLEAICSEPHMWSRTAYIFTCMSGQVRLLFEGGYYFYQQRQSCGYYSRAGAIQCAGTIRGNTVTPLCVEWDTYSSSTNLPYMGALSCHQSHMYIVHLAYPVY